jgi:glucoamylase
MRKSGDENRAFEIWKPNRQVRVVKRGYRLSVQVPDTFRLHWTNDEWHTVKETPSATSSFGVEFVDIPITAAQRAPIRFTFFWPESDSWEGCDQMVEVGP